MVNRPSDGIGEERLSRKLVRVALPLAVQDVISSSLGFVDNLMVGKLGETQLATVGLATQVFFVFWMFLFGFTSGTVTYMAQFWGKRDLANIRKVTGISVTCCLAVGMVFFIACMAFPRQVLGIFTNIDVVLDMGAKFIRIDAPIFLAQCLVVPLTALLRATQQTKLPLVISTITLSINTALGALLIFGLFGFPRCGFMGACYALLIARLLELALYIFVIFVQKNMVAGAIRSFFGWSSELFKRVLSNAIPTTLNESLWGIGVSMYSAVYGRMGVTQFAAIQASDAISDIFAMACFSLGDAMLILVGEKLGRGELGEAFKLSRQILVIAVGMGVAVGLLIMSVSYPVANLFNFTPEGLRDTHLILIVNCALLFVQVNNGCIVTGALRAGGDTKFAMVVDISSVWLVGLPVAIVCALYLHLPIYIVVLAIQSEEVIKAIILQLRYRSKKWVRNLIDNL